jgi:hypothetical protein
VRPFSPYIPAFELVVDSLDDVVYVAPEGGPLAEPETFYTVSAPDTAAGKIAYHIEPPAPAGEPTLDLQVAGSVDGELGPGESLAAETKASIVGVPCGTYLRTFQVQDLTNGYTDILRHIFEIGLAEFAVSPAAGLTAGAPGPLHAATATYEVSNRRPTAAVVEVAADGDWITLDGEAAPAPGVPVSATLRLAPAGEPGDRATVVVGLGGYADLLAGGEWHHGQVTFANLNGTCEDRGDTVRTVSFPPVKE